MLSIRRGNLALEGFLLMRRLGLAELFFFVVTGEEDLAVLVEAVEQTFDGFGRVPHKLEDMPGWGGSQA